MNCSTYWQYDTSPMLSDASPKSSETGSLRGNANRLADAATCDVRMPLPSFAPPSANGSCVARGDATS
eukprot:1042434-Rhodomonas_salina.4